jgi:hypothetical protein
MRSFMSVGLSEFDEEKERVRLSEPSDEDSIREGNAARSYVIQGDANVNRRAKCL